MALAEPTTKITEPIPALIRPGRPARLPDGQVKKNGHSNGTVFQHVVVPPMPENLPAGSWSEQATKVLRERYLLKNEKGEVVETPDQMCWRVAWDIACAEGNYGHPYEEIMKRAEEYYQLMMSHEFLPNSPTLANAGKNNDLQYSACYVLPVEDSLEGIFDSIKWQAVVHQSGGGTGFAFSRLRPAGSIVKSTKGIASGPVSFMKIFDSATEQVKQGGMRRGANMGILRIDHPDVLEFIHCKDSGGITNFNISLAVTDAFMKACFEGTNYDLVDPRTSAVVGQLDARRVVDEIADGAWRTGDPGMIFIDQVNDSPANPVPSFGPVESTNPCGEQPLYPFDACNLGSVFLTYFVKETDDGVKTVDWEKLRRVIKLAVRFLDGVIDRNPFPLQQIRETVLAIRRIGLGVGGWADMLAELGIAYDSQEAIDLAEKVMKFINENGHEASEELAVERGPFPAWPESIYKDRRPLRNSTVTTIAPTGSIGIIANSSTGIEPFFAMAFRHYVKTNVLERTMNFFNPLFEKRANGQEWYTDKVRERVAQEGTIAHITEIPEDVRKVFVTAHDILPEWHVKMQAVFQKYTDNAVSKTINLPNSATRENIKRAYIQAYEGGCRGITVYRDGCKAVQVLNLGTRDKTIGDETKDKGERIEEGIKENGNEKIEVVNGHTETGTKVVLEPRPVRVDGATYRIETPLGSAFITVNEDAKGSPFEVFINIGKAGSEVAAMAEALGRLISTTLRFGNHLPARERAKEIVDQLSGIGGGSAVGFGANRVRSLPDAVAKAISMHFGLNSATIVNHDRGLQTVEDKSKTEEIKVVPVHEGMNPTQAPLSMRRDLCPSCGSAALVFEEGCGKCLACGYSKC